MPSTNPSQRQEAADQHAAGADGTLVVAGADGDVAKALSREQILAEIVCVARVRFDDEPKNRSEREALRTFVGDWVSAFRSGETALSAARYEQLPATRVNPSGLHST